VCRVRWLAYTAHYQRHNANTEGVVVCALHHEAEGVAEVHGMGGIEVVMQLILPVAAMAGAQVLEHRTTCVDGGRTGGTQSYPTVRRLGNHPVMHLDAVRVDRSLRVRQQSARGVTTTDSDARGRWPEEVRRDGFTL
jgi:hypothetical protein